MPAPAVDFRALYRNECGYVRRSVQRLGVSAADADDAAHEVFLAAYQSLPRFDASRPLRPWLFGIAFRVVSHHQRQPRHRQEVLEEPPETADERPTGEQHLADRQRQALVLEALAQVEPNRRAVFVMAELEAHPVPEIAEALEVPLNTAYSRLRLARQDFVAAIRRLQASRGALP